MSLARIIGLHTLAVLVGLLVVSAVALWGLNGLRHDYGQALSGYAQLRDAYEVGARVETARVLMTGHDAPAALRELRKISARLDAGQGATFDRAGDVRLSVGRAERLLAQGGMENGSAARAELNAVLSKLATTSADVRRDVEARQQTAEQKRDVAMWWVGTVCAAVIVASVVIAWSHYRAVTVPVARLTRAAQELAVGRFDGRVAASGGPRELVELARQFDRMADELHSLYKNLEDRVQQTGRQLVRSEHLAGLGTLAAGVAHEINNPLGIIAGYAQMMTRAHDDGRATVESFKAPAGVIVDEAFRCKRIVERLLTFSRVGAGPRARVDLAEVARGVVTSLRDSGTTGERSVELDLQPAGVFAVADEVKQVVMNLILNAIEATRPDGKIQVVTRAVGVNVECVVRDDGAGMDAGTIARATEPFFSDRRGKHQTSADGVRGTGLGLSICDAIVRAHGGSITLTSDGPGRGTSVTVHLPAVVEGAV